MFRMVWRRIATSEPTHTVPNHCEISFYMSTFPSFPLLISFTHSYPAGSVVMLLLNMNFGSASAYLVNPELSSSSRDVYWLTPPNGNLTSTSVLLNGQLLQLVDNTEVPDLKPTEQPASSTITLPPISFGFYVFKDTKAPACM